VVLLLFLPVLTASFLHAEITAMTANKLNIYFFIFVIVKVINNELYQATPS
jgi:hypothetical protein